jgi:hypothetical protein
VKRYAIVKSARSRDELERYLPDTYKILGATDTRDPDIPGGSLTFVIGGEDFYGWTLDGYVIPRLASGTIFATEIDLSHPIMKRIPA